MSSDPTPLGEFDYSVFGLRVRSTVPLPELFPGADDAAPDVTISTIGEANGARSELNNEGALFLNVENVGRYKILSGNRIIIDANPGVPERNIRLFLLGSAFGALLHQRGLLPLHANAADIEGNAVAFMAASGEGKSTLAAWFYDRGYRVVADDVCVVGFDELGQPYAAPGLPRLRLWSETLEHLGLGTSGYDRSYVDPKAQFDKFDIPIASHSATSHNIRLAALYVLDVADQFAVTRLKGLDAAEAIFANTYRGYFVSAANNQHNHWQSSVRLVRSVPVFRASREWGLSKLEDQCRRLLDHASAQTSSSQELSQS